MSTPERRGLLKDDSPMPPTPGTGAPTPFQTFTARHRPGYARVPSASVSFSEDAVARDITDSTGGQDAPLVPEGAGDAQGLGIAMPSSSSKARRVSSPLAHNEVISHSRSGTNERTPVMSPPSTGGFSGSTSYDHSYGEFDSPYGGGAKPKASRVSLQSNNTPSVYAKSDAGLLSIRSRYDNFEPHHNCQSTRSVKHGRFNHWVSMSILALVIFSFAFSAVFLAIALKGPRYGRTISNGGALTPSSAAFLTSLFAKLIELSFVTVVVAFVGQALARRAFKLEKTRGVTLAEMSMRSWIMQPGTMLTNWESVRYAGISILGIVSLIAALMAILYTSAATALVQPQLKWPNWQHMPLQAEVKTQFSNPIYIGEQCKTPITLTYDKDYAGTTCLQMEHASMAYHNFYNYMSSWFDIASVFGNGSFLLPERPKGYALLNDNTTITAPWIEVRNISQPTGTNYTINNITMAIPHPGIVQAAIDPLNEILQPDDVEGAQYNLIGSLPSPMVNSLCVTMHEDDLEPFVLQMWNRTKGYKTKCNQTDWSNYPGCLEYRDGYDQYLNLTGTPIGDIFGFGPKHSPYNYPPVFPHLPTDYNTLLNETKGLVQSWGRPYIYVLGKGGPTDSVQTPLVDAEGKGTNYALCQLAVGLTPNCSSHYNASSSGGVLEAVCEDEDDPFRYDKSVPNAISGNMTLNKDWPNIGSEWARSLSLSAGLLNGSASTARLLTQLIVTSSNLSMAQPSMAEALAVLAGNTLVMAAKDSPLIMEWNYTLPTIEGMHQYFNASVRVQQYASGGSQEYQKPFYVVLFAVVIMNFIILIYFLLHRDWYTDFSEPAHMFSLAVNSPPSEKLAGSCGCGPQGEQYRVSWKLNNDEGHFYVESQEPPTPNSVNVDSPRLSRRRWTESFEMMGTPMTNFKNRFSRAGGSPATNAGV